MIEVTNLTRHYGSFTAVDHISFSLEDGKIYGFLGPNGAGKSTTMNLLTGYLCADEGNITVDGFDMLEEPKEAKKRIGYLPELPPLYKDMTVREYLRFVIQLKKADCDAVALDHILRKTGLTDVVDKMIRSLSKGFQQRVGIAQALVGNPPILILDEPTVGLDPLQRIEVRELIRSLGKEHTVILSSHILSEISEVCDTVLIIAHGKLVGEGSPEQLAQTGQASQQCSLSVKGQQETVLNALSAIDLVPIGPVKQENGLLSLTVSWPAGQDKREEIFYALAAAHCPILEETITAMSLEQIFLELTGEDKDAQAYEKVVAQLGETPVAEEKAASAQEEE